MQVDPITLEIIRNRLREIGATMEHLLFHSGYSTILRESHDGSAVICDIDGYAVESPGHPIHLLPYYYSLRCIRENYSLEEMKEGDCFIVNDPYIGGSLHVPDVVIFTPIYADGAIIGFVGSMAHKPDMGGLVPGSSGAGAREIFHEGLLLPGVRYWSKAGVNKEVEALITRNCRIPEVISGDLRAQVGCTLIGVQHVQSLCQEYGTDTVKTAFTELLRLSEKQVRDRLRAWPDGESEAETFVDHDGVDLDKPVRLHVKVVKKGDSISFDYSASADQVKGPTNLRPQSSQVAALLGLMVMLDPSIPFNDGVRRAVEFVNPEGKITNPRWPAPVNSYYGLSNVLYSTVGKALAKFNPERAVASAGLGLGAVAIGYERNRTGRKAVQYDLFATAQGGTSTNDGSSGTVGFLNLTPSTPIEVIETEFPVRVVSHDWIKDSAGPGIHRGGLGNKKVYELLGEATLTLRLGHQFDFSGWGVFGGKAPRAMRATLNPGAANERVLRPLETIKLMPGDRFSIEMAGGGGYGDPRQRAPELVVDDIKNGYVSIEAAEKEYGIAVRAQDLSIDSTRTKALRA
jgi:N-methylhydantoinase B